MLALIACTFTFTACGDDDEEDGGNGSIAGAPYPGVWMAYEAEGYDNEEGVMKVSVNENEVVLTLNDDKSFSWVDKIDNIVNEGYWEYKDSKLYVYKTQDYGVLYGEHDVLSWTPSTLRLKVWYHHKDPARPDDFDEWVIFSFRKK